MSKETGGPAFPSADFEQHEFTGMTLRDYFAAKAMQSFIIKGVVPAYGLTRKEAIASMAYETADEMLKAREQ